MQPPAVLSPVTPLNSMPAATASEKPTRDGALPSSPAIPEAMSVTAAPIVGLSQMPPTIEPTPEQWAHLLAIRSRLSPREAAIVEAVVIRMTPEMRARWLAELTMLSLDEAAEVVRSQIPKPPLKPRRSGTGATDEGEG